MNADFYKLVRTLESLTEEKPESKKLENGKSVLKESSILEMDKSQPSSDRGGESSGDPYAKGGKATPVKSQDMDKHAEETLNKAMNKAHKKNVKEQQQGVAEAAKWRDPKYRGVSFDYNDSYEGPGDARPGKLPLTRSGQRDLAGSARMQDPLAAREFYKKDTGKITTQDIEDTRDKNFGKEWYREGQGVAEGSNKMDSVGARARAKTQMIKMYGDGEITFRKTSNGGYFIQHEDDFGDTNSHQYDPQTGEVDFSGVTRSSYYGEGVAEGKKSDRYHIVGKDGKPVNLASYADRASAIKDRDEKYPGAVVQQVGPRGKVKGVAEGTQPQFVAARYVDEFADGENWYVKGSPDVIKKFVLLANSLEDEAVKGTEYEPNKGMMAKVHAQLGDDSVPQWTVVKAQNLEAIKPIGNKVLQLLMKPDLSYGAQEFMSELLWTLEEKGLALVTGESQQGVAEGSLNEGQYEMMMRNGQVKKFIAKDDADAKRIAAGHGAKSVIRLRGGVPAGKVSEQGVAEGLIDEGVNDPHIFKAIAMIGPMGAGKSTIARQLVGGSGLRSLNLDNFNELLIKQGKVAGGNLTPDQLERNWELTQKQKQNWINERLGLLIDGSGRNIESVVKPITELEQLGYDTMVILVNVSLETSIQRQQSRAAQQVAQFGQGRNVPLDLAKSSYQQIQQNIPKLKQLYGNRLLIINNEGAVDLSQETTIINRFMAAPPSKPAAVSWIKAHSQSQGQKIDKQLAQQQRQQASAQRAQTHAAVGR